MPHHLVLKGGSSLHIKVFLKITGLHLKDLIYVSLCNKVLKLKKLVQGVSSYYTANEMYPNYCVT